MTTAMTQMFRMTTVAASQVDVIGTGFMALDGTTMVLSGLPNQRQPNPVDSTGSGPKLRLTNERSGWLHSKRDRDDCQSFLKPRMSYPQRRALSQTAH